MRHPFGPDEGVVRPRPYRMDPWEASHSPRRRQTVSIVGLAGFEPATSCTQSTRASQAALQPGTQVECIGWPVALGGAEVVAGGLEAREDLPEGDDGLGAVAAAIVLQDDR